MNTMNGKDRQTIENNIDLLANSIDLNPNLINQIINKNIFTQPMVDDILSIVDEMDRKKRFLYDLTRRGPTAYDAFVEVLYGVDQIPAARVLRPESFHPGIRDEQLIQNLLQSSPPELTSNGVGVGRDTGDYVRNGGNTVSSVESQDFMVNVVKSKAEMSGNRIYRMLANPRGYCLIFNFFEFSNNTYEKRLGSESETNRLRDVFSQLHFSVEIRNNLSLDEMKTTITEFSQKPDLRRHDALVLIVLSHGHSGYVVTSDGKALQFEDIVSKFNNENCPLLINKPKLFFFNCCRGDSRDLGPKFQFLDPDTKAVADAKKVTDAVSKVPLANDMLICYSTVDGYVSWRNEDSGSWFGTALSQTLMKEAHDKELNHILIIVCDMINNKVTQDGEKQVMEYTSRGIKKLFYFNPGIIRP